jgi:hypothetical protein
MQLLIRDPLWQFIATLVSVVYVLGSLLIFFFQRRRKSLSYVVMSNTLLFSSNEIGAGKLQVVFKGKTVKDPRLIVVKISNSGNVPIPASEYEIPVALRFGESTSVLTADIHGTTPGSIKATVELGDTEVILNPLLLNPGDSVTLKTLVSHSDGKVAVAGRIVGVREIKVLQPKGTKTALAITGAILILLVVLAQFIHQQPILTDFLTLIVLGLAVIMAAIWVTATAIEENQKLKEQR